MADRWRLKIGPIEIEYVGESVPSRKELLDLVSAAHYDASCQEHSNRRSPSSRIASA